MTSIRKAEYLENPCRASSIPYWKAVHVTVPEHMKILHEEDVSPEELAGYADDPYFRLKHDLHDVKAPEVPAGFSWTELPEGDFAAHICRCYREIGVTEAELAGYARRPVYCPELWVALRDNRTNQIVATGIGELDREIGEGTLEWIQVSPEFRGLGLGKCIVRELLRRMQGRAAFATVSGRCHNETNPETLYRSCGFTGQDVWHILIKQRWKEK